MKIVIILCIYLSLINADLSTLESLYKESKSQQYTSLSSEEFRFAKVCFETLFQEKTMGGECQKTLGLTIKDVDKEILVINDRSNDGQGLFMVRYGGEVKHMLSMPHSFYDLKSGEIGLKLYKDHPLRAAVFNTVHRDIMDSAHTEQTLFTAFHSAFATLYSREYIYQLHGFSNKTRSSNKGKKSDFIISTGKQIYGDKLMRMRKCIESQGYSCSIYGMDIDELGGTTNAQLHHLQQLGYFKFVHMELNYDTRKKLSKSSVISRDLIRCLVK